MFIVQIALMYSRRSHELALIAELVTEAVRDDNTRHLRHNRALDRHFENQVIQCEHLLEVNEELRRDNRFLRRQLRSVVEQLRLAQDINDRLRRGSPPSGSDTDADLPTDSETLTE